jgi:hypothetical protein
MRVTLLWMPCTISAGAVVPHNDLTHGFLRFCLAEVNVKRRLLIDSSHQMGAWDAL